ncbi:MAG: hypothetical protein IT184_03040 [Acidobacteria bacterium]|nr:hypothetical protein [Acidobacteriota bacterium]
MDAKRDDKAETPVSKRAWHSPRLEQLGSLRDFVREGNAFGKSGPGADGMTSGNNEAMM